MAELPTVFVKVLMLGHTQAGKTSLLQRFFEGKAPAQSLPSTMGVDFREKVITTSNATLRMQVWDTAGQEKFSTITPMMYRGVTGVILVYDITDRYSFERVVFWMKQLQLHADPNLKKVLVGNKYDLEKNRVVSTGEGQEYAKTMDETEVAFFETSALNGRNVESVFNSIAQQVASEADAVRHLQDSKQESFAISSRAKTQPTADHGCKCGGRHTWFRWRNSGNQHLLASSA